MGKRLPISKKTRFEVLKRDNFTCRYCGAKAPDVVLEIDHVKPVAGGGCGCLSNLRTACIDCNRGKGVDVVNGHDEDDFHRKYYMAFQMETDVRKHFNDDTLQVEVMIHASLLFGTSIEGMRRYLHDHDPDDPDGKERFLNWLRHETFRYMAQVECPK
jgi:hypothetical protein